MGRGAADGFERARRQKGRRVVILPFEQPVVDLEPDRSDPRMRLKQNWSFQARERVCSIEPNRLSEQGCALWR
jgi:hypothetical protein